jgi:hypothetical protein
MARENSAPFRTRWRLQLAVLSTSFCAELATAKLPTFDPEFFQFSDNQVSAKDDTYIGAATPHGRRPELLFSVLSRL